MQGNSLWEMEKYGAKLPPSEHGFGFEMGRMRFDFSININFLIM